MLLKAIDLENKINEENLEILQELKEKNIKVKLLSIRVGDDYGSILYEKSLEKTINSYGGEHIKLIFNEDDNENEIIGQVKKYLDDDSIGGILLLKPFKNKELESKIDDIIDYKRDLDAVNFRSKAKIYDLDFSGHVPITALASLELLKFYGYDLTGENCLVINRSQVVGIPLSLMLLKENATVTIAHSKSKDLKSLIKNNKYIFTAIGKADFFDSSYFNSQNIVVDISTNYKSGKVTGDVLFDDVVDKVAAISPVPGGVGRITKSLLIKEILSYYL